MGLFERKVRNGLEDMFDMNRDGMLDVGEEAFMFSVLEEDLDDETSDDFGNDFDDDSDDDFGDDSDD